MYFKYLFPCAVHGYAGTHGYCGTHGYAGYAMASTQFRVSKCGETTIIIFFTKLHLKNWFH